MPEPVPSPLRSSLVDAMGGWGPFTVREIERLFTDHGFEETAEVEPEQGVRRTTAAQYLGAVDWSDPAQRRRLIQLAEEVLEFYPPDESESAVSPGRRLRRALARVSESGAGPEAPAPAEVEFGFTTDSDDPFDVWPPGRIRLFFSHTSAHRALIGEIATALEYWPFACFVAHEEIEPSLAWQEVIESALATCDALVAFFTADFRESAWCDQEVGWALGRGLVTIPVGLYIDPHGFAGSIQAVPASLEDSAADIAERVASALTTAVFRQTSPGAGRLIDPLADAIVEKFCGSPSFALAQRRFEFLRRLPTALWTPARRLQVEASSESNRAIREGVTGSGESLPTAVQSLWA
jgi:hypothetical protein